MDIPDCKKKRVGVRNIADLTGVAAYVFVNLHTFSSSSSSKFIGKISRKHAFGH